MDSVKILVKLERDVAEAIKGMAITPNETYSNILRRKLKISPHKGVGRK